MTRAIDLTKPIQLDDGEYRLVQRTSSMMTLIRSADREVITMPLGEVSRRAADVSTTLLALPQKLDLLSPADRKAVHERNTEIEEVLFGMRPGRKKQNPLYDLAKTTETQRVESKANELDVSARTMWRWVARYREDPETGAADLRAFRQFGRTEKLTADLRGAFAKVLNEYPKKQTVRKSVLVGWVKDEYLRTCGEAPPALSRTTWNKYLDIMSGRVDVTKPAKRRQTDDRRPDKPYRPRITSRSGELIEMDTTKLDVDCLMPSGNRGRIAIAAAIDVHNSSCRAISFASIATRSVDQISLLVQMTTQPADRPGLAAHRERLQGMYPEHRLLTGEEYERKVLNRPFVYPSQITVDNGSDFSSAPFLAAARRARISVVFAPPGSPAKKPHIERFNLEIAKFAQTLPGSVGNSVANRGAETPMSELLSYDMVMALVSDWAFGTYNTTPGNKLHHDAFPGLELSPNDMLELDSSITRTDLLRVPVQGDDYLRALPIDDRILQPDGIHFKNLTYWSDDLHPLLDLPELTPGLGARRIQFHYDGDVHEFIWAIAPDGSLIECEPTGVTQRRTRPHEPERDVALRRLSDRVAVEMVSGLVSGTPAKPYVAAAVRKDPYAAPVEEPTQSRGAFDPNQSPF
ncbi:DDE-type integrase/transposase/recombinase [Curtobacterium sp. ISL-83]|uniref:DDE-type integrase/transposase/recombinase n=1 Tax=Curtobacterium sp. ISL-83 TaxID=2819145 RepID=UPI001BEBB302|nr:DDE-type integrase/transposase/recombinase [Curtobacterium sp. ISL-83]MBT2501524.1 DDE-type integrase/transposase/recombinase [Curtobacterium sp. ISL-83]